MADEPIISVKGLQVGFDDVVILDNLDIEVRPGEILGIVGGSGTGKSVLLRTIMGLHVPRQGTIEILGEDALSLTADERHALSRNWGILFQQGALFSSLTVAENIEAPLRTHLSLPAELMAAIADVKISMVGLDQDARDKYPSELSGGMKKRAGLARALALDPKLLFLDEPTAGLDPIGAAAFDKLILELRNSLELTVVLVTHDLDTLYAICDRIAVLGQKRVMVIGSLDDMLAQEDPWIVEYFHGPRSRQQS